MKKLAIGTLKRVVKSLLHAVVGAFIVLLVGFVVILNNRPDLAVWHEADLDEEFEAGGDVKTFAEYLELEDRLFAQLDELVYAKVEPEDKTDINRYNRGSRSDPGQWARNWNHTFEFPAQTPAAGVLLLHGMSDSPYSMRSLGNLMHEHGAWVVGLRVPGHGTAPSGLVEVHWKDMAAAVEIAVRHLDEAVGDAPLFMVGYSNGGALAVEYGLSAVEDTTLPRVQGVALLSPAIGVTPAAAFAVWQGRLGHLLGLDKLAWNAIGPEYDPYKYTSFAVNAGDVTYRLTKEIQDRLTTVGDEGALDRFPSVLAFQSALDATVSAPALVTGLFQRLPPGDHELVLFDLNRLADIETLLKDDPLPGIKRMLEGPGEPFTLSLVTNEHEDSERVIVRCRRTGRDHVSETPLELTWPPGLYSLAHVALPFPEDDPLYGRGETEEYKGIRVGNIALRGERNVLSVSASSMLRLHWNPFHDYLEARLLEFTGLEGERAPTE